MIAKIADTDEKSAAETTDSAPVIDLKLFRNRLRTIQALRNSGVITNDGQQSDVQLLKRINHAAYGDYSDNNLPPEIKDAIAGMQKEFQHYLQTLSSDKSNKEEVAKEIIAKGYVHRLLDDHLGLLIEASEKNLVHLKRGKRPTGEENDPDLYIVRRKEAEELITKYKGELASYQSEYGKNMINDAVRSYVALIEHPGYLSTGKIVAMSGVNGEDKAAVNDLTNDVMGVQSARNLKMLLGEFDDNETLQAYAADPHDNTVRINGLAKMVSRVTRPLTALKEFEAEEPQLDRIRALNELASARVHYAMMEERTPEERINIERAARQYIADCTQVAMSLACDYMDVGPAAQDKRTRTIQSNLKQEMKEDGIAILPTDEAIRKAGELASQAAQDLMTVAGGDTELVGKIVTLAEAAGAKINKAAPQQTSPLIGNDLIPILQKLIEQNNQIMKETIQRPGFFENRFAGVSNAPLTR